MEASSYIRSSKEKENMCLFCGEPVEYGWVSDYKGTRVWICRNCVLEGEIGSLMASAILDKEEQDNEILEEINRCLETIQMKFYRNVLYKTFKKPSKLHKIEEGAKEKLGAAETKGHRSEESKGPQTEETPGTKNKKMEKRLESRLKDKDKLDEDQLLRYLEDWKSLRDIQQQLKIGYKPLLEKLDAMYRKGTVDKKKVRLETGGHKYKYKKISEEEKNPINGGEPFKDQEAGESYRNNSKANIGETEPGSETGSTSQNKIRATDEGEVLNEDQLLRYLEDWKSVSDIQQKFGIGYKPLVESLNRLFFRGYLLKKTVPDNPMFKRAVNIKGA
ncbi:MAG: hypothetical protein R6U44_09930 [Archaeoglobaceae archaeon]